MAHKKNDGGIKPPTPRESKHIEKWSAKLEARKRRRKGQPAPARRPKARKSRWTLLDEQRKEAQRKPSGHLLATQVHNPNRTLDTDGDRRQAAQDTLDILGHKYEQGRRTSRGGIRTSDTYVPAKKPEPAPDKRRTTLTLPAPPKERIVGEFYRLPDDYYHRPPKPKPAGRGQHGYKRGRPKKQKREQRIREDFGWTPEPYDLDSIRLGEALPDHGARPDYLGSQERHLHARAKEDDPGPTERERQRWRLTDMLAALAKDHAPGKSWWRDDDVARWFATDAVPDARTLISMFGLSPAKEAKALAGFEQVFWGQIDYQRWLRRKKTGKMTKV